MTFNSTRVTYLYCDGSNYKFWGTFVVSGKLDLLRLRQWFFNGEFFVPERIGIKSLVPEALNSDDHTLHQIETIELCLASEPVCTARQLVCRAMRVSKLGWFSCQGIYV